MSVVSNAGPEGTALGVPGFARLSRDSIVYALGSVAGKAIAILLLPFMTRLMTPEEYGRFDLLSTLGSAGISVLLLGLSVAVTRLALDPSVPDGERPRLIGSWFAIEAVVLLPSAALIVIAGPTISYALFGPEAPVQGVQLVSLILVGGTIHYMVLTILRIQQRAPAFTALTIGTLALNALLAIALLLGWMRDELAPLLAYGVSLAVGAVFGLFMIGRSWFARPQWQSSRRLLHLGLPLVPALTATWLAEFANRMVLNGSAGAAELGFYSVALRFASVASLVVAGFQLAWQPRAFALGSGKEALRQTAADGHRILVVVCTTIVVLAVASPEYVRVVSGPAFISSLPALGLSLCGVLATAGYLVTSMPSALAGRFRDIGISGTVGVGVGFALNVLLAPTVGSVGTAFAITVGQLVATVLVWHMGRGSVVLPLPWRRIVAVGVLASWIAIASTLPEGGALLAVRVVFLIAFASVLWFDGSLRHVVGWIRSLRP